LTQITDLTTALATVTTDFTTFVTAVDAEVAALQAAIATGVAPDLSSAIVSISNLDAAVKAAQSALPPPPVPASQGG